MGVEDINDFSGRLQTQIEKVQQLESGEDGDAIIRWAHRQDVADSTLIGRLSCVRLMSERADKPLVDFENDSEVMDLLNSFNDGSHPAVPADGLSDGSVRQYRQAARLFFRDELDRDWGEEIVIGTTERPPITPEKIIDSHEVDALLEASTNPRDSALIAFLCVTGQRITAALSIVLDDVEIGPRKATIRLNDDAKGLKGASGPRPLLWARPYIATWLENHPRRGDPDAPLFCTTQGGERPHEDGHMISWEPGDSMSHTQAHNRLKKVANKAGVDTERVKPHNFRHTAITRMRDEGVADDRIKFMVGVAPDSDILERYDQADNEKMMNRLRADHGLASDEELSVGRPSLKICPQCQTSLRDGTRFCPQCGTPLDAQAANGIEGDEDSIVNSIPKALSGEGFDDESVEFLMGLRNKLNSDPELKEFVFSDE